MSFYLFSNRCDGQYKLWLLIEGAVPKWRQHGNRYFRYGYLLGMTGDQIQYATQASQNAFIMKPVASGEDRRVDVCIADILGINYVGLSGKFYLGFDYNQFQCLKAHFQHITSQECAIDVHAEFEVKHVYFDMLHRALDKLASNCIARIMPEAKDFQEGLGLSSIPFPRKYPFLKLD